VLGPANPALCAGCVWEDPQNVPAVTPLLDPPGLYSVMCAFPRVAVPLLETREVHGVIFPDIVAHPPAGGDVRRRVLRGLLGRERRRWTSTLPGSGVQDLSGTIAAQAVSLATLTSPNSRADTIRLLPAVPDLLDASRQRLGSIADWLHELYPGVVYLAPLRPDLLAEQHLADTPELAQLTVSAYDRMTAVRQVAQLLAELTNAAPSQPTVRAAVALLLDERLSQLVDQAISEPGSPIPGLLALALRLAPPPEDDPVLAERLTALGAALIEGGQLDQAAIAFDRAERIAAAAGEVRLAAHAQVERLLLGLQVDLRHATAEVGRVLPNVFKIFREPVDELGLCRAWRLQAAVRWNQANSAGAEKAWRRAAIHARRAGDQRQLADILGWRASAALWGPTPAPKGIQRCMTYLDEVRGHPTGEAEVLLHLAGLYAMQDRLEDARHSLAEGQAILDSLGPTMISAITGPVAFVAMLAGDPAAAEMHLRRDYESLKAMGEKAHLATTAALLAQAITAQGEGRHDEAESYIAVSREAGAGEDVSAQIIGQGVLARILAARGRLAEAEELARGAVALAERTDLLSQHGDALLDLAHVLYAAGRARQAQGTVSQALGLYQRKGDLRTARQARQRLQQYARP
jgi:tetratricopeptide (TPR) repeat protein